MSAEFQLRQGAIGKVREAVGYGMLNLGLGLQARAQAHAPVAGGHRTFNPDQPIGGTLRRSIHTVAYVDGRRISPAGADENGEALPDYAPGGDPVVYVGSNSGYGFWVHEGTSRMAARPFLQEAWQETQGEAVQLIAAGTRRRLGR